jgi:transcriptional regulator with XRE-family HTH domain
MHHARVPNRERLLQLGTRRGERLTRELAEELREARLAGGLTQRDVGRLAGLSKSALSRIESGRGRGPTIVMAARIARVVGLDLSVRCFPAGGRLRDAAHVALVGRFLARVHPRIGRTVEAPIPMDRDQRAWDVLLTIDGVRIGVAAETRLRDLQALLRREQAKQRDGAVDQLLLVVADTRANRHALQEARVVLEAQEFAGTRVTMAKLERGVQPTQSGYALV